MSFSGNGTGDVKDVRIVVCIPTFRRSEGLRKALEALACQSISEAFAIVIVNNDPSDHRVRAVVDAIGGLLRISVVDTDVRGVSSVRNLALEKAMSIHPEARWCAFQDDDEEASPQWLAELAETGQLYDADMVGSWNTVLTPGGFRFAYLLRSDRRYWRAGRIGRLKGTNSLLISTRYLRGMCRDPFRLEFGATGGEDYEFFRYARSKNACFAWADKADIFETWPQERYRLRSLFQRRIRVGAYEAVIDREYEGLLTSIKISLHGMFIGVPKAVARSVLSNRNPFDLAISAMYGEAYPIGRILGLLFGAVRYYS